MWARLEQSLLEFAAGDPREAQATSLDAARACQAVGDQALEAEALAAIGETYRALGDIAQVQSFYRAAILGYAAVQDPWREAAVRATLARCLTDDGHQEAARAEWQVVRKLIADYDDTGIAALRREMADALGE
jgi:tetratricopeptide (TPR) repeat protein